MRDLVIFCADVGSVRAGNFGWARTEPSDALVAEHDSSSPKALADAVVHELLSRRPVALGFECPLFVPVPTAETALGGARVGEGNRAWSAGAGTGALATGLVQAAWVLRAIRVQCPDDDLHLTWPAFCAADRGLLIWEAFVTAAAKGATHVDDAAIAVAAFSAALPDPTVASTITAPRPMSLAGACALWSGWLEDPVSLHKVGASAASVGDGKLIWAVASPSGAVKHRLDGGRGTRVGFGGLAAGCGAGQCRPAAL